MTLLDNKQCHQVRRALSLSYLITLLDNKECHQVRKGFIAFLLDDIACQHAMITCRKVFYRFLTWWHCLSTLHVDLQCRHCETLIRVLYKCSKQLFVSHPIHGGVVGWQEWRGWRGWQEKKEKEKKEDEREEKKLLRMDRRDRNRKL